MSKDSKSKSTSKSQSRDAYHPNGPDLKPDSPGVTYEGVRGTTTTYF